MIGLTWLCILSGWALGAEPPLTLKAAIQMALDNSPTIQAAQQQLKASELREQNARMQFYPIFDLKGSLGGQRSRLSQNLFGSTHPIASDAGIFMTSNIYDNGVSLIGLDIAKKNRAADQLRYERARDQIIRDVAVEFFNFALLTKVLEIQVNQVSQVKAQYNRIATAYKQGLKPGKDYLRFKTQTMRNDINLETAKADLERARLEVLRLLRATPDDTTVLPTFSTTADRPDPRSLPREIPKFSNHYETLIADILVKLEDLQIELADRRRKVEVLISSGANYGAQSFIGTGANLEDRQVWNLEAMVTLRYRLFDYGIRKREVEVARVNREGVSRRLDQILVQTQNDIEKLMVSLNLKMRNFKLSDELLKLETKNYNALEADYRIGKVQYLDLILGLNDLADARVKYFTNLYQFQQDLFRYQYHNRTIFDFVFRN